MAKIHLRYRAKDLPMEYFSFGEPRTAYDFVAAYRKGSYVSHYTRDYIEIARGVLPATGEVKPPLDSI